MKSPADNANQYLLLSDSFGAGVSLARASVVERCTALTRTTWVFLVGKTRRNVEDMNDNDNTFGAFLTSRRARLSPEQAGLPAGKGRRVPGLRRGEVAMLADVSVEYVARLERGAVTGVSEAVLDSLARALQLDDTEREHLTHLAQLIGGGVPPRRQPRRKPVVRESMQLVLDSKKYVERRSTEGLSYREIKRVLKRYLARNKPR